MHVNVHSHVHLDHCAETHDNSSKCCTRVLTFLGFVVVVFGGLDFAQSKNLKVCTSLCRQDQRLFTIQGALLCCDHYHVDKTRTFVTFDGDLNAWMCPAPRNFFWWMVCRVWSSTVGRMIVLCQYSHWRDA